MTEEELYKKLKPLVQYRDMPEDELKELVTQKLKEKEADLDIVSKFKDKGEKKVAKDLIRKYLKEFSIENVSDKNTLKELIFLEVVQNRLQDKLNVFEDKDSESIPFQLIEIIHKNSDVIIKLKNTLGIFNRKTEKAYDVLKHLQKRAKKWREDNQASRTLFLPFKCLKCGDLKPKPVLLKIRTEIWEAQKHPFFKDKILFNAHLVRLYLSKKITKDDVAKVLETSSNYTDWLVEKVWKTNPDYQRILDDSLESGKTDKDKGVK